jgi:hypothetical protein
MMHDAPPLPLPPTHTPTFAHALPLRRCLQEHRVASEAAERESRLRADKDAESSSLQGQLSALQSEKRQLLSILEDKRSELAEKRWATGHWCSYAGAACR